MTTSFDAALYYRYVSGTVWVYGMIEMGFCALRMLDSGVKCGRGDFCRLIFGTRSCLTYSLKTTWEALYSAMIIICIHLNPF